MIKETSIKFLRYALHFSPVYKFTELLSYNSRRAVKQHAEKKLKKILAPDGAAKVLHGPFTGMKYPPFSSIGWELAQKILGAYESELHPTIEQVCKKRYASVVNIGAAEGYYAIGLALRMPGIKVYAFEIDLQAAGLCRQISGENKVEQQIEHKGECNAEQLGLLEFSASQKGLIVCDCEGCEMELLNPTRVPQLVYCDLLVEVHDLTAEGLSASEIIYSRFDKTHKIKPINIKSRDPNQFPELKGLSEIEKDAVLAQRRIYSTGWMFLESKAC